MSKPRTISSDAKRFQRVEHGIEGKRQHKTIARTLREFQKVGAHDDTEVYEEMVDDLVDVLRVKK